MAISVKTWVIVMLLLAGCATPNATNEAESIQLNDLSAQQIHKHTLVAQLEANIGYVFFLKLTAEKYHEGTSERSAIFHANMSLNGADGFVIELRKAMTYFDNEPQEGLRSQIYNLPDGKSVMGGLNYQLLGLNGTALVYPEHEFAWFVKANGPAEFRFDVNNGSSIGELAIGPSLTGVEMDGGEVDVGLGQAWGTLDYEISHQPTAVAGVADWRIQGELNTTTAGYAFAWGFTYGPLGRVEWQYDVLGTTDQGSYVRAMNGNLLEEGGRNLVWLGHMIEPGMHTYDYLGSHTGVNSIGIGGWAYWGFVGLDPFDQFQWTP